MIFFESFFTTLKETALALSPLLLVFFLFQAVFKKLSKKQFIKMLKGILLAFAGICLFLQGVQVGFLPIGEKMGIKLGSSEFHWILIPVGLLLGFCATLAEPAVYVLNEEVEKASSGHINKRVMLYTLSIGVAFSVALSMLRVLTGIPLWYFILPGYTLALILAQFVDPEFVGIALDSGGVATGPMSTSFILSMTVGIAKELEHRSPLMDGFGTVALVAMTPILAVLILGFLYTRKERSHEYAAEIDS